MEPCCPTLRWIIRGMVVCAAMALAWFAATPLRSQEVKATSVLTKVPPDALGFVHVKFRDVWKAEALAGLRDMMMKAGPATLDAFNKRFTPAPSTIDAVVVYALPPDDTDKSAVGMVVSFADGFDTAKVLKALLPKGVAKEHFGQKYADDKANDVAVKVVDGRTLLLANARDMQKLLSHEAKDSGPLTAHFASAGGSTLYAAFEAGAILPSTWDTLPAAMRPLAKAKQVVLTGQIGKDVALKLRVQYPDEGTASAAEKATRDGLQQLRDQLSGAITDAEKRVAKPGDSGASGLMELPGALSSLFALAAARSLDDFLAKPPLAKSGDTLNMDVRFDPNSPQTMALASALGYGVLMPAAAASKEAAGRASAQANLKQIGLALHQYHREKAKFPTQAVWSKDGKKQNLSWRVSILPYLGEKELYKQFKLDEPWDSENNKKLIDKIPVVFQDVDAPLAREPGTTHYQVFFGGGAGFRNDNFGIALHHVTDGTSQSIMVVTAANPVVWTKPEDLPYSGQKPIAKLGLKGQPANVLFFDGSVRALGGNVNERLLRALITAANGELIGDDF